MTEKDRETAERRIIADIMSSPPDERISIISYYMLAMFTDTQKCIDEHDVSGALCWFRENILMALPEEDRLRFFSSSDNEDSRELIGEVARVEWLNGNPALLAQMASRGDHLSLNTRVFVANIVSGKQKRPHGNSKPIRHHALAQLEDLRAAVLAREALDAKKWLMRHANPLDADIDRAAKESLAKQLGIGRSTFEKILGPYPNVSPSKNKKSPG